jgi:hypothetical protein
MKWDKMPGRLQPEKKVVPLGRAASIYLPGPYCNKGHKRTAKNTNWGTQRLDGGKYVYRVARCKICASLTRKIYYQKVMALSRADDR